MATTKYIDIKLRTKSAEASADKLDGKMKGLGATADKTSNSFSVLSKVAAAVGTAILTGQITRYADAYTSLQNQVRQTTKSTEELTQRTKDLLDISNRSRAGISSTSELYTQLVLSTENLNLSTEEQLRLTETITKSFAVSGKSAADAAGSIRQLGQAFASGTLRGDEFNSIAEGAPEIMRALQRSLNLTQGELRDLAATGGITAKILVDALGDAAEVIDTKFNNSTATMAQNIEVANNNLTEFIGSSTTVQNVMGGLGGAIVTASENISTIVSGAVLVSSIFAARLVPSMIAYSSSLIANTTAQLTNGTAATKTANVYGVVTVSAASATVATNALTLAARAATAAMTFLGGPLGIALIAATALYTFGDSVTDLNRKVSTATPEMDAFAASIEKMSRGAKGASLANINNEMTKLRATLTETQAKLDVIKVQNSGGLYDKSTIEAAKYRVKIKEINDQLDLLSQKQGIIVGAPDLSNGTNRGNINDEQPKSTTAPTETPTQSQYSINLAQETEALQIELALRQQVEQGYLSQRDADTIANYEIGKARRLAQFESEIAQTEIDEQSKIALRTQYDEAERLRKEIYENEINDAAIARKQAVEDKLTEAELAASEKRKAIAKTESDEKKAFYDGLVGQGISFGAALLKNEISGNAKSEKEKKKARKKGVIIDTAAGIARAFAENNFYTALGISAGIAANGLTQIANINSASENPSSTASASSASSAPTPPASTTAPPVRNRTVDIRTDGSAFSEAVKDAALVLFNGGDDDVVLNITNAQNELIRTGGAG